MFQARPADLSDASQELKACSSYLESVGDDVSSAPPSEVFGLLPESVELATALGQCVQRTTTDLGTAAGRATKLHGGLAVCAKGYATTDAEIAEGFGRIRGATAA